MSSILKALSNEYKVGDEIWVRSTHSVEEVRLYGKVLEIIERERYGSKTPAFPYYICEMYTLVDDYLDMFSHFQLNHVVRNVEEKKAKKLDLSKHEKIIHEVDGYTFTEYYREDRKERQLYHHIDVHRPDGKTYQVRSLDVDTIETLLDKYQVECFLDMPFYYGEEEAVYVVDYQVPNAALIGWDNPKVLGVFDTPTAASHALNTFMETNGKLFKNGRIRCFLLNSKR